jgi:ferritin-like metal-binding protein YciE
MKVNSLDRLFVEQLRDVYDAEKQMLNVLPKMASAAATPELQKAFDTHAEQTRTHLKRLEEVFEQMGEPTHGKKCRGMAGLIDEGKEMIDLSATPVVRDAGLIAAAQRLEHYELAAYGCLRAFAKELGNENAWDLLSQTLGEEANEDKLLTQLAISSVNHGAVRATAH